VKNEGVNESLRDRLGRTEIELICGALTLHHGCVAAAARWLKIPLSTLRYTMAKHRINPNDFRSEAMGEVENTVKFVDKE